MADGRETASIVFVEDLPEASSLVGDHASGATVWSVADGRVFGEAGVCRVADVDYDYERLDDTLTVSPGLVAAALDGEPVARVGPEGLVEARKVVHLDFDGDSDVDSEADVRSSDRGYFPDGDALAGAEVDVVDTVYGYETVSRPFNQPRLDGALVGMPIKTAESGKRVEIVSDYNGAVLFFTGSVHEDPPAENYLGGAGYIGSSATELSTTVVLQTVLSGPQIVGAPSTPTMGLSSQETDGVYLTSVVVNADQLKFNGDRIESTNLFLTAAPTTGGAANVNIGPGGQLRESTSALRYKQDIRDAKIDPAAVLKLQGKTWRDRNAVAADPDTTERHVGFIAEDLDALGLREFVDYVDGEPNAIQYDRLSVALLEVVKRQETRLAALEQKLA